MKVDFSDSSALLQDPTFQPVSLVVTDFVELIEKALTSIDDNERQAVAKAVIAVYIEELQSTVRKMSPNTLILVAPFIASSWLAPADESFCRYQYSELLHSISLLLGVMPSLKLVDVQSRIDLLGRNVCYSAREHFRSQCPLTVVGANAIATSCLENLFLSISEPYKVLLLDADNTLWGEVLGEVGSSRVQLHPTSYPGNIYWRAQHEILKMKRFGILLVLLTKNDRDTIEDHLRSHPYQVLQEKDFVLISADWTTKPTRAREIASKLGLGLDSMLFLDDSPSEILAMQIEHPRLSTIRVPENLSEYLSVIKSMSAMLENRSVLGDRTDQYRQKIVIDTMRDQSSNQDEFLKKLQTQVNVFINDRRHASRVSELSQRTNQFNATLKRFSTSEIESFISSGSHLVLVGAVSDIFGESGTSIAIVGHVAESSLNILGFWVSCRVLGRKIEDLTMVLLAEAAMQRGLDSISIEFIPGPRNSNVQNFLRNIGPIGVEETPRGFRFTYSANNLGSQMSQHLDYFSWKLATN